MRKPMSAECAKCDRVKQQQDRLRNEPNNNKKNMKTMFTKNELKRCVCRAANSVDSCREKAKKVFP